MSPNQQNSPKYFPSPPGEGLPAGREHDTGRAVCTTRCALRNICSLGEPSRYLSGFPVVSRSWELDEVNHVSAAAKEINSNGTIPTTSRWHFSDIKKVIQKTQLSGQKTDNTPFSQAKKT